MARGQCATYGARAVHRPANPLLPVFVSLAAIGMLSLMDAFMKEAALAVGAFSTLLLRAPIGLAIAGPLWRWREGGWPAPSTLRLHLLRGVVVAAMGFLFFFSLTLLPLAQAIAISFVAPLIALFLARVLLGEQVGPRAIGGALLGLAGVLVILAGKVWREALGEDALIGIAAVLASAVLYAWNLILQRQQALVARPLEVATFQNGTTLLALAGFAPFFLEWPQAPAVWGAIGISALLSTGGAMMFAWAYARAEAQVLVPIEYTGFLWAALFGWLFFREPVTLGTGAGAALIVIGCWVATRRRPELTAV